MEKLVGLTLQFVEFNIFAAQSSFFVLFVFVKEPLLLVSDLVASIIQRLFQLVAEQGTFPRFFFQAELIAVDGVFPLGDDGQQVSVLNASLLQLSADTKKVS